MENLVGRMIQDGGLAFDLCTRLLDTNGLLELWSLRVEYLRNCECSLRRALTEENNMKLVCDMSTIHIK